MSVKSLILHPRNPYSVCKEMSTFIKKLRNTGFLGETFIVFNNTYFRPGTQFYNLITFVSSHPISILENTSSGLEVRETIDSKTHCRIHFREISSTPQVIISPLAAENLAECPNCACVIENWPDVISEWYANPLEFQWTCPNCRKAYQIHELDWRHAAGFARYAIEIESIYPKEAYPNDNMMMMLERETGEAWTYLYSWI